MPIVKQEGAASATPAAPTKPKQQWPLQANVRSFFGAPGLNHTFIVPPFAMFLAWDKKVPVKKILINSRCSESALRVLQKVAGVYSSKEIKELGLDLFGGCFNNRPMRGGSTLSMHAYACAIDFDPDRNQLKWSKHGDKSSDGQVFHVPRLSRPDAVPWWEAWEEEGWVSLGRARDFDWMHVQAARLS